MERVHRGIRVNAISPGYTATPAMAPRTLIARPSDARIRTSLAEVLAHAATLGPGVQNYSPERHGKPRLL
jgi:NAD(P)-dependent dehydrogenase (short-subunit alcohol dehydrogenase family)